MPIRVAVGLVVAVLSLSPLAGIAQQPVEIAFAKPQPHFVAAWAPAKPREAERSAVLGRRVSLELADVSLDEALKELIQQAGLNITYSPAVLPAGRRVTISAGNIAVVTALTEILFRSGLDVVVDRDGALALVVCRHPAPRAEVRDSGTVVGTVTDKATGAPIAGATVAIGGTALTATTESEGRYRIEGVPDGRHKVRVRYIGYAPMVVDVDVLAGREAIADFKLEKSLQKLDELVTTGTVVPTEVKALPTPISLITERDVAVQRPQNMKQLLRQAVPTAVGWDQPHGPYYTGFTVRGASTLAGDIGQMKVFIDGVETASPSLAAVDPASIERVEVVRGPQAAAIYGSDAIGGVIHVFTKRAGSQQKSFQINGGVTIGAVQTPYSSFGEVFRQSYTAALSGRGADLDYNIGGSYVRTGDYLPDGEISRQSSPSIHGGVRLTQGIMAVDVSGRYYVENAPAVINPELFHTGIVSFSKPLFQPQQIQNQTVGVRLGIAPRHWWQTNVTGGIDRVRIELIQSQPRLTTPDDSLLFLSDQTRMKTSVAINTGIQGGLVPRLSGALTAGFDHYSLPANHLIASGLSTTTGTIATSSNQFIQVSRSVTTNTGYFLQGQLSFRETFFLTGGLRADDNSDFGDSLGTPLSPRAGASYVRQFGGSSVKLRASYGRGIRAPVPGQKLGRSSPQGIVLANSRLGPERQDGWDAGFDFVFGSLGSLGVTYYDQIAKNLIQNVQVSSDSVPVFQNQNVGRVKNTGVEVEGALATGAFTLRGQYGYARSRIEALAPGYTGELRIGDQTLGTPHHTVGLSATVELLRGLTVAAGLTHVGRWTATDYVSMFKCFGGTGPCYPTLREFNVTYPSLTKINANIVHQLSSHLSAVISIENLTNTEAFELDNSVPIMGRTTTIGFQLRD